MQLSPFFFIYKEVYNTRLKTISEIVDGEAHANATFQLVYQNMAWSQDSH